jgi:glutamine amidotransferase
MARLFGLIGNRADLMARVFAVEGATLKTKAKGAPLGWGLGFYQGGEVLIRRRPIDERLTSRLWFPTFEPTSSLGT